jgi:hypothetical protein
MIELQEAEGYGISNKGQRLRARWPQGVFRFRRGQYVWVRDRAHTRVDGSGVWRRARGGYTIVQARVRERHYHPGRHPFYPNGEGYALDGELWWDCYPGCRVFATREEVLAARMGKLVA